MCVIKYLLVSSVSQNVMLFGQIALATFCYAFKLTNLFVIEI